jgi:hypothetical protein
MTKWRGKEQANCDRHANYAQCREAVGNGRSDFISESLLLVSRVWNVDLMLVMHGIWIIPAGVIVALHHARVTTTKTP